MSAGPARRNHSLRTPAVMTGVRQVRRFHTRKPVQISGCSQRCIVSTSRRSQSVSTYCTSSGARPGFQHERSRLLRKSAANSSSAILPLLALERAVCWAVLPWPLRAADDVRPLRETDGGIMPLLPLLLRGCPAVAGVCRDGIVWFSTSSAERAEMVR